MVTADELFGVLDAAGGCPQEVKMISQQEWTMVFSKMDPNRLGAVSRKDWFSKGGSTILFDRIKGRPGGNLSLKEWQHTFSSLDTDADGHISLVELTSAELSPMSPSTSLRAQVAQKESAPDAGLHDTESEGPINASLMKQELRDHMVSVLLGAVRSGKLDECASTVAHMVQREKRGSILSLSDPAGFGPAELRERMLNMLAQASRSGKLEEVAAANAAVAAGDRRRDRPDLMKKKASRIFE